MKGKGMGGRERANPKLSHPVSRSKSLRKTLHGGIPAGESPRILHLLSLSERAWRRPCTPACSPVSWAVHQVQNTLCSAFCASSHVDSFATPRVFVLAVGSSVRSAKASELEVVSKALLLSRSRRMWVSGSSLWVSSLFDRRRLRPFGRSS